MLVDEPSTYPPPGVSHPGGGIVPVEPGAYPARRRALPRQPESLWQEQRAALGLPGIPRLVVRRGLIGACCFHQMLNELEGFERRAARGRVGAAQQYARILLDAPNQTGDLFLHLTQVRIDKRGRVDATNEDPSWQSYHGFIQNEFPVGWGEMIEEN